MDPEVAILGLGHLGEAVLAGLLDAGFPAGRLTGTALPAERAADLGRRYGVAVGTDGATAAARVRIVLLVVPPPAVAGLAGEIAGALAPGTVVVTLAAGVATAAVEALLPEGTAVVRAMTNTAVRVGEGMTALSAGRAAGEADLAGIEALFRQVGATVRIPEDAQPVATAIAGSGPALVYHQAAALIEAATADGLAPDDARTLVVQTLKGAAATLAATAAAPAELVAQVATPGGTTREALDVLDDRDTAGALKAAVRAAVDRATVPS